MPCLATVIKWLSEKADFLAQYRTATEARAESIFEDILEIADDQEENVQRSRLRCDARYWVLARMAPKRYGDKQVIEHNGNLDMTHYLAHDQKIIDRYNARRAGEQDPVTIDHKPAPAEE